MKQPSKSVFTFLFILVAVFFVTPNMAHAFSASEKEQMREDVREALNRARDFHAQKLREATENIERQKGAKEVTKARSDFEAEQEMIRKEYVKERNERPSEFLVQARAERSFDEQKLIEDREMDKSRREYLRERRKVQHIIDRKAYINPAEEYGL